DRLGGLLRDDAELGLGMGQRDLDIEPGLPAVFLLVEGADAGIGNPRGGRQFVAHWVISLSAPARSSPRRVARRIERIVILMAGGKKPRQRNSLRTGNFLRLSREFSRAIGRLFDEEQG